MRVRSGLISGSLFHSNYVHQFSNLLVATHPPNQKLLRDSKLISKPNDLHRKRTIRYKIQYDVSGPHVATPTTEAT